MGPEGEKGYPGVTVIGPRGTPGIPGYSGRKGISGPRGDPGFPGKLYTFIFHGNVN